MDELKNTLSRAIRKMLRPLARLLLRYDISHREFAELAKRAYIDAVNQDFLLPNRKHTFSRVAVLTGLTRKEVVRLSQLTEEPLSVTSAASLSRARRVVGGWLRDPEFTEHGLPRALSLRGEGASFETLVGRYSGDISARAILDELIRVGVAHKPDKHSVALTHAGYIPEKSDAEKIEILSKHVVDLLSTAAHNIECKPVDTRFQRQVTYSGLPDEAIAEFRQYSHDKSLELLLDLDRWLAERKKNLGPGHEHAGGRVGVGVYFFRNDKEERTK